MCAEVCALVRTRHELATRVPTTLSRMPGQSLCRTRPASSPTAPLGEAHTTRTTTHNQRAHTLSERTTTHTQSARTQPAHTQSARTQPAHNQREHTQDARTNGRTQPAHNAPMEMRVDLPCSRGRVMSDVCSLRVREGVLRAGCLTDAAKGTCAVRTASTDKTHANMQTGGQPKGHTSNGLPLRSFHR